MEIALPGTFGNFYILLFDITKYSSLSSTYSIYRDGGLGLASMIAQAFSRDEFPNLPSFVHHLLGGHSLNVLEIGSG